MAHANPTSLRQRLLHLIGIPCTSHEAAAILQARHRTVYATLCLLKKEGKAIALHKKRDGARGPLSIVFGLPGVTLVGMLKMSDVSGHNTPPPRPQGS